VRRGTLLWYTLRKCKDLRRRLNLACRKRPSEKSLITTTLRHFRRGFVGAVMVDSRAQSNSPAMEMAELQLFHEGLVRKLRERGVLCAITSGPACVHYGSEDVQEA